MRLCIVILQPRIPHLACFASVGIRSLSTLALSLCLCQMTHTLEGGSGFRWFVRSFVRPSFALLLFRAEHLRKGDEVQSKVESWVESWVHPVI